MIDPLTIVSLVASGCFGALVSHLAFTAYPLREHGSRAIGICMVVISLAILEFAV